MYLRLRVWGTEAGEALTVARFWGLEGHYSTVGSDARLAQGTETAFDFVRLTVDQERSRRRRGKGLAGDGMEWNGGGRTRLHRRLFVCYGDRQTDNQQ